MSSVGVSYVTLFDQIQTSFSASLQKQQLHFLQGIFNAKLSENTKCLVESAVRDYVIRKVCNGTGTNLEELTFIIQMCIEGAREDLCLATLPVLVLSDVFECIPIEQCEKLFFFVEDNVSVWKEALFFSPCKNQVLRMCNDVLRRLSRYQNTVFCGRILLFLARFFPFSERSGLNLISEFNLENVTVFNDAESNEMEVDEQNSGKDEKEPSSYYTIYPKFWALQDFFRNPQQCYQKEPWERFTSYADAVLEAFSSFKLDTIQKHNQMYSKKKNSPPVHRTDMPLQQTDQYFAKYLTNKKLLDLQFSDSNFRRYILLQMLILVQYLTANIKFKQETLMQEQKEWIAKLQKKVFKLLLETPPESGVFVENAINILKKEEIWNEWKNGGCAELKKPSSAARPTDGKESAAQDEGIKKSQVKAGVKRKLGDMIREDDSNKHYAANSADMLGLWNVYPENLESCRRKERDFIPSLETYFSPAIDECIYKKSSAGQKMVSNSNFGWRGLRLLACRSPHFFTHSSSPIATLPEFLNNMIKKLAKDFPVQPSEVEVKPEEEEETKEIEEMDQGDNLRQDDDNDQEEETQPREELTPISEDEQKRLAASLAKMDSDTWKALARKLGFESDEVDYFESEGKTVQERVQILLERWVENEKEEANRENLLYTLEGLKLEAVAKGVFL